MAFSRKSPRARERSVEPMTISGERESLLGVLDPVTRFDGRLVSASRANVGDFLAEVREAFKRSIER